MADGQVERIGCAYGEIKKGETKKDAVVRLLETVCGIIVDADKQITFEDYLASPSDTAIVSICQLNIGPTEYTQVSPLDENMRPIFLDISQKNTLVPTDLMSAYLLRRFL